MAPHGCDIHGLTGGWRWVSVGIGQEVQVVNVMDINADSEQGGRRCRCRFEVARLEPCGYQEVYMHSTQSTLVWGTSRQVSSHGFATWAGVHRDGSGVTGLVLGQENIEKGQELRIFYLGTKMSYVGNNFERSVASM